jgi:hypothetical protein
MNVKETVQNAEQEQNAAIDAPVAKKDYEKPQLTAYEDLKRVTAKISLQITPWLPQPCHRLSGA